MSDKLSPDKKQRLLELLTVLRTGALCLPDACKEPRRANDCLCAEIAGVLAASPSARGATISIDQALAVVRKHAIPGHSVVMPTITGILKELDSLRSHVEQPLAEPKGCPTPGACSCPGYENIPAMTRDEIIAKREERRAASRPNEPATQEPQLKVSGEIGKIDAMPRRASSSEPVSLRPSVAPTDDWLVKWGESLKRACEDKFSREPHPDGFAFWADWKTWEAVAKACAPSTTAPSVEATPAAWQVVDKDGAPVKWLPAQRIDPATFANPEHDLNIADNNHMEGFPHRWEQLYRLPAGVQATPSTTLPNNAAPQAIASGKVQEPERPAGAAPIAFCPACEKEWSAPSSTRQTYTVEQLESWHQSFENLRREFHRQGNHDGQRGCEFALEAIRLHQMGEAVPSATREQEGYPGIAHDLESMRVTLGCCLALMMQSGNPGCEEMARRIPFTIKNGEPYALVGPTDGGSDK
jgi:hypothetical protein